MAVRVGDIGIPDGYPHYDYRYKDADKTKIEMLDTSPDPEGVRFSATKLKCGREVGANGIPTRAVLRDADNFVFDIEYAEGAGNYLISEKVRDIFEAFEPGVHKFWPVEVEHKTGRPIGTKYLLNICRRLDTINRDLTVPSIQTGKIFNYPGKHLVFDPNRIAGHHMWIERYILNYIFLSDDLWCELLRQGCTGWQANKQVEEIA